MHNSELPEPRVEDRLVWDGETCPLQPVAACIKAGGRWCTMAVDLEKGSRGAWSRKTWRGMHTASYPAA